MTQPVIGIGTTVTFSGATGIINGSPILDHSLSDASSPEIRAMHSAVTGVVPYISSGVVEAGALEFNVPFDPDKNPYSALGATGSLAVTYSDGSVWTLPAVCNAFSYTAPLEDRATGTFGFRIKGALVIS